MSVSSAASAGLPGRVAEIAAAVLERTYGNMTIEAVPPEDAAQDGPAAPLTGGIPIEDLRYGRTFRCGVRKWSLDTAAWTTEVFVDALRAIGMAEPALITICGPSAGRPPDGAEGPVRIPTARSALDHRARPSEPR